jgi:hypothetical protein
MRIFIYITAILLFPGFTIAQNTGIGTITPTEKLDVATGNMRIRDINASPGSPGLDKTVVADATTGVLKTLTQGDYSMFYARLANDQTIVSALTPITLIYSDPIATSALYSYNIGTGILTFNQIGNYLITMQVSFGDATANAQLITGIRLPSDANYLARGTHYNAVAVATVAVVPVPPATNTTISIGELMQLTTMLKVETVGYQIKFVVAADEPSSVLATEIGSTGSGNVSNVTIQKI